MKKLIGLVFTCIVLVAIVDFCFGAFCNWYLKDNSLAGEYANIDYLFKQSNDDILILGSSVARRSLIPSIIEDSLGLTCFNGGASSQNIPYYVSVMKCVIERHKPNILLLGLHPYEFGQNGINVRYKTLAPYYGRGYNMIDSCLETMGRCEPYLLKSNLYRYNYNHAWLSLLSSMLKKAINTHGNKRENEGLFRFIPTSVADDDKGFTGHKVLPVHPTLYEVKDKGQIVEQRKEEFIKIAEMCSTNGIQLYVFIPPQYIKFEEETEAMLFIKNYCREHNIPCFDDLQNEEFLQHKEWFYDNKHLNKNGAVIYTEHFITELKEYNSKTRRH